MELCVHLAQTREHLGHLQKSKIRLLMLLDQRLRVLGVDLLAEHLYTADLDDDITLRLELCNTIMRERAREARRSAPHSDWLEHVPRRA